ncbi:MAG: hypothetical protein OEY11_09515, partial [Gammaproteobacteria bacterium]|nr:hypothetical protein [Gammaproteobacteria bacterium]
MPEPDLSKHLAITKRLLCYASRLIFLTSILSLVPAGHALAAATNEVVSLHVTEDIDVDINIYAADGKKVLLWLACNEG